MNYNYETQSDLMSITQIAFNIDTFQEKICIVNNNLSKNKVDSLSGYVKPYLSDITANDLENFKLLFNLKLIEINISDWELNERINNCINQISEYFANLGNIETIVYNRYDEIIFNFNIGLSATPIINETVKSYVLNTYGVYVRDVNEFTVFLRSLCHNNNKSMLELHEYRYSKLLNYVERLESRIDKLEKFISNSYIEQYITMECLEPNDEGK